MDIRELTEAMNSFVTSKGWYEPETKRPQTPRNLPYPFHWRLPKFWNISNGVKRLPR